MDCLSVNPQQLAPLPAGHLQSWMAQSKGLLNNPLVALSDFAADRKEIVPSAEDLHSCRLSIYYTMQDNKQHF